MSRYCKICDCNHSTPYDLRRIEQHPNCGTYRSRQIVSIHQQQKTEKKTILSKLHRIFHISYESKMCYEKIGAVSCDSAEQHAVINV